MKTKLLLIVGISAIVIVFGIILFTLMSPGPYLFDVLLNGDPCKAVSFGHHQLYEESQELLSSSDATSEDMIEFVNEYHEIRRGLDNIATIHNCVFYDLPYGYIQIFEEKIEERLEKGK